MIPVINIALRDYYDIDILEGMKKIIERKEYYRAFISKFEKSELYDIHIIVSDIDRAISDIKKEFDRHIDKLDTLYLNL